MATKSRRTPTTIIDRLRQQPEQFDFFQAVRLLELSANTRTQGNKKRPPHSVGSDARPSQELLNFRGSTSLAFPGSEISVLRPPLQDAQNPKADNNNWNMQVSFMGLTGSTGVLPFHYSELIQQRNRLRDETLSSFLDMFNHRSVSLFYRAWKKYRFPLNYESHYYSGEKDQDKFTQIMLSLLGLGTKHITEELPLSTNNLISLGGILSKPIKSAMAVEKMLQFHLNLPVKIAQFQGHWVDIQEDTRSSLPCSRHPQGINNQLGVNAMLGSSGWQVQSKFSVKLPDLNYEEFMRMRPNGEHMKQIKTLTRFATGNEFDFDIHIGTNKRNIPRLKLSDEGQYQPLLGWNTVLSGSKEDKMISVVVH